MTQGPHLENLEKQLAARILDLTVKLPPYATRLILAGINKGVNELARNLGSTGK
jgi:hypothetical protein